MARVTLKVLRGKALIQSLPEKQEFAMRIEQFIQPVRIFVYLNNLVIYIEQFETLTFYSLLLLQTLYCCQRTSL